MNEDLTFKKWQYPGVYIVYVILFDINNQKVFEMTCKDDWMGIVVGPKKPLRDVTYY